MKKSTIYLLFFGLLFFSFRAKAQNFALGVKGGISIPSLSAGDGNRNPLVVGYEPRLAPGASIFAEFKFSDRLSFQPMIEYSSQGGKKDGLQAFTTPDEVAQTFPAGQAPQYLYANYNNEVKMNYIIVPLLLKFGWDLKKSPFRFYADGGPFAGWLLSAHKVTSGQSQFYTDPAGQQALPGGMQSFDKTTDIKDQLHQFNFGIEINIGFNYKFGRHNIFIEGGGNFGALNIQKFDKDGRNETGAGTLAIGYSCWFGK